MTITLKELGYKVFKGFPDAYKTPGNSVHIPLERLYEKGHYWNYTLVFEKKSIVYFDSNKRKTIFYYWANPKENVSCGPVDEETVCMCDECIKGREEVKKGWKP